MAEHERVQRVHRDRVVVAAPRHITERSPSVGSAADPLEVDADRVADDVMRMFRGPSERRSWMSGLDQTGPTRIQRSSSVMGSGGDVLVQRKFDNLPTDDVAPATGPVIARDVAELVDGYNATPSWDVLDGTTLTDQLDADRRTLPAIDGELTKAFPEGISEQEAVRRSEMLGPFWGEVGRHNDELTKLKEQLAAAEEAAKPLSQKHLTGLDEPGRCPLRRARRWRVADGRGQLRVDRDHRDPLQAGPDEERQEGMGRRSGSP